MDDLVPSLVDYHCHLDLYPDYEAQFRACAENRIATLAVTTTPRAWPRNRELAEAFPFVRAGIGLHPQIVETHAHELSLFERHLPESRHVGEVGLDASPAFYKSYEKQRQVFEAVLTMCAGAGGKIVSIHSVRATRDVLALVERHLVGTTNRIVMHWFSGSFSEAREAAEMGAYFSINQAMLSKPAGVALVASLPRSRLLTESDGPFTKVGSRPATPLDVAITTRHLAELLGMTAAATQAMLNSNLTTIEAK